MKVILKVLMAFVLMVQGFGATELPEVGKGPEVLWEARIVRQTEARGISYLILEKEGETFIVFPEESYYKVVDQIDAIEKYAYACAVQLERDKIEIQTLQRRASRCDQIRFAGLAHDDSIAGPQ